MIYNPSQAFVCLSLLAVSSAAPAGPVLVPAHHLGHHVGHHVAAGQHSHQSVSTAHGEVRTLSQSKAFGATHASVAQADNSKGLAEIQPAIAANRPVPVGKAAVVPHHAIAPVHHAPVHPVAHHAVHHAVHPVAHHAVHPVAHHAVHAAPAYAPAPVYHKPAPAYAPAPVVKVAPAYHAAPAYKAEEYPDEISPYTFAYAVADDYSKANFQRQEESDGASNVAGSYSVALPDGRIQHVTYTTNGYDGYVADVTYEGTAVYPEEPAYKPAPAYQPVVAAPAYKPAVVAHAVHAAPVVAHAVAHAVHAAPVVAHPVAHAVAPVNYGANKPVNGYGHGQVSHQSVSKPYQGEHRSTTQSKAFGAHAAVVAD